MDKAAIISVFGRVQGVAFRYYTAEKAKQLGLSGIVRNKANGSVYIEVEGEGTNIENFIHWCKTGPDRARVIKINHQYCDKFGYEGFVIR